ncbi:MAG: cupin-like domain-containing protein [Cyanobacteria bacterium]|nr:cupin-like domain-containing protein [Cyanobacteriota bacterium]
MLETGSLNPLASMSPEAQRAIYNYLFSSEFQHPSPEMEETVLTQLVRSGSTYHQAKQLYEEIRQNPLMGVIQTMVKKIKRRDWALDTYRRLAESNPNVYQIERLSTLSREMVDHYYLAHNRPFIHQGIAKDWPALHKWSPEHFKERFFDTQIEVQANREKNPRFEIDFVKHKAMISMPDFVDRITSGNPSNDLYLTANNSGINRPLIVDLCQDMTPLPEYLDPSRLDSCSYLWFGGAGTLTPLHHDNSNNLVVQLYGRKRFRLTPMYFMPKIYNEYFVHSEVDAECPDFDAFPLFKDVPMMDVVIEPGDAIMIPAGWWHHVRSLDVSISMTLVNVYPENFFHYGNFSY